MMNKERGSMVAILLVQILFGLSFLFTRLVLASASALTLLSWRFFLSFAVMNLLRALGLWKVDLKGRPLGPLLLIGLFHPLIYYILETTGIGLTSASESGVMVATIPIVSMLLAMPILKEYPTRLQTVSIIVSVLGVCVVVLGGDDQMLFNPLGYVLLMGAVVTAALFFIVSRRAVGYSGQEKTYVMMGMGTVGYTLAALVEHLRGGTVAQWVTLPFRDGGFLITILYLGVVTSVVGSTLQNMAIGVLGVNRSASFSSITTVVTIVAGVAFLGESFTLQQVVGTVLILAGVTGANWQPRERLVVDEPEASPEDGTT